MLKTVIAGTGSYLPEKVLSNDELSKIVDTSDEWIQKRTGIQSRHMAAPDQLTSDLASAACLAALQNANISPKEVDLIICATTTPDRIFPATANRVQHLIGADQCASFDIQAACSGFVYALSIVDQFLKSGMYKTALIVGAETFTRLLNWEDRNTCVLFGDGAGAVVLQAKRAQNRGILGSFLASDGSFTEILCMNEGPSLKREKGDIIMHGKEVFKQAVLKLSHAVEHILKAHKLSSFDIDWFIPHQANKRIIDATAAHLSLPKEKVIYTVQKHANTSAASIPLALDHANKQGLLQPGELILFDALGAGFTWGASLVRW